MTNAPATPDFDARLALLRQRFAAGLAARRDELARAWERWSADPAAPDTEARAALAVVLHRLSGAAGAYGYEALGRRARQLETLAIAPDARPAGLAEPLAALLAELSALAGAAAAH